MRFFLLFSFLMGLLSPRAFALTGMAVAGAPAAQVFLVFDEAKPSESYCAGTLVNPSFVITAAHCAAEFVAEKKGTHAVYMQNALPTLSKILNTENLAPLIEKRLRKELQTWRREIKSIAVAPGYDLNAPMGSFFHPDAADLSQVFAQTKDFLDPARNDLAVLTLDHPFALPADFVFPTLALDATAATPSNLRISATDFTNDPLISRSLNLGLYDDGSTQDKMRKLSGYEGLLTALHNFSLKDGEAIEAGDSGAPVYARTNARAASESAWTLLGVSQSYIQGEWSDGSKFQILFTVPLANHAAWLKSVLGTAAN